MNIFKLRLNFFLFTLVFFQISSLSAQEPIIYKFQGRQMELNRNINQDLVNKELDLGKTKQYYYSLIAFDHIPNNKALDYLKQTNVELLDKISDHIYVARFHKIPKAEILQTAGIKSVKNIDGQFKITPSLQNQSTINGINDMIKVSILLYSKESFIAHKTSFDTLGFNLTSEQYIDQGLLIGTLPNHKIKILANFPFVKSVNFFNYGYESLMVGETGSTGLNNLQGSQSGGFNLSGKGITVGVGDDADPTSHIDLLKNLHNRNPSYILASNHGTRVAGIVSGDGIIDESFSGVAPSSEIVTDFFDYIISKTPTYKKDYGLTITNNSYYIGFGGCVGNGDYSIY